MMGNLKKHTHIIIIIIIIIFFLNHKPKLELFDASKLRLLNIASSTRMNFGFVFLLLFFSYGGLCKSH